MIGRFLDPKNDFAFKPIFGREQNKIIECAFDEIERMNWSEAEYNRYESSFKAEWDNINKMAPPRSGGLRKELQEELEKELKEGFTKRRTKGSKQGMQTTIKQLIADTLFTEEMAKKWLKKHKLAGQ